jgi:hypothetical protein
MSPATIFREMGINYMSNYRSTATVINLFSTFGVFVKQKPSLRVFDRSGLRGKRVILSSV